MTDRDLSELYQIHEAGICYDPTAEPQAPAKPGLGWLGLLLLLGSSVVSLALIYWLAVFFDALLG